MRDKLRALYYPDFWFDYPTLIKSILLFDEIHIMDRPSLTFDGQHLTVGMDSPLRQHEQSFRDDGVPLFVHEPPSGPVFLDIRDAVEADLADRSFVLSFQDGLRCSQHFRDLHIQPGNYGVSGTHETIFERVAAIDFPDSVSLLDIHNDRTIRPFDFSSPDGVRRHLVSMAAFCSAKMNYALDISLREGFSPYADMGPYGDLLSAKYSRAVASASTQQGRAIAPTDLSLAILDELVPAEITKSLTIDDAIKYRKESESAREAFLEYLLALQLKLGQVPGDGDYTVAINTMIASDIRPAATQFRNKLDSIYEKLFGKAAGAAVASAASAVAWVGSSAAVHILGDVTWQNLLGLTAVAAGYVASEAISAHMDVRAANRDCALSYLLDLEK